MEGLSLCAFQGFASKLTLEQKKNNIQVVQQ